MKKGFTLVELIVVLSLILIISSFSFISLKSFLETKNKIKTKEFLYEIEDMITYGRSYCINNNINFNGEKVYLVIDGIVVKAFNLDKNDKNIELLKNNLFYGNDIYLVTLELDNGAIIEISLREYLLGAIATNMIPNIPL